MLIIVIEPVNKHGRFAARLGFERLCVSRQPLLDSARVLAARGVADDMVLIMRHKGSQTDALRSTVGAAAKLTARDDKSPPAFEKWKALPHAAVEPPMRKKRSA